MKGKKPLVALIAVLLIAQGALHRAIIFPNWSKNYNPKVSGVDSSLSPDQLLFALAGFRELVAGILWVRADSFFETGNYDAVLPIVRLVTWLDPHQIDVYSTGMWHIAYNFTDEDQRSDRRYIASALALGKEGTRQNPDTYELFFEQGWLWFHKIDDDFDRAVYWFEEAHKRKDIVPGRKNLLATALEKDGKVGKALGIFYKLFQEANADVVQDVSQRLSVEESKPETHLRDARKRLANLKAFLPPADSAQLDKSWSEYDRMTKKFREEVAKKGYKAAEAMRANIITLAEVTRRYVADLGTKVRQGDQSDALRLEAEAWGAIAFDFTPEFTKFQMMETLERNIDTTVVRMVQRGWLASQRKQKDRTAYDTYPPFDVGLAAEVSVEDPAVIRVRGTWNVLSIGSRLRVILRDPSDPVGRPAGMNWDNKESVDLEPNPATTYMQDNLFVKNRKFNKRIDMSKDRTMYPFAKSSQDYIVEVYYSPRSTAPHLQDKFGFNGEGLADALFLNKDIRPGQNVIYATLKLTRDQLLRKGEWQDKVPVVSTPNFKSENVLRSEDDVILVPSMRAGGNTP